MAEEKAAVKATLAEESSFRREKQQIVAAMGASPAMLLTPSSNPNLQRKVGAYTNSVTNNYRREANSRRASDHSIEASASLPLNSTEESSFRREKEQIVAAMGASPAVLLTPSSSNPNLTRNPGEYSASSPREVPDTPLVQHLSQPFVRDDAPRALERHNSEAQQYQEEERHLPPKASKCRFWIIGGISVCVVIGAVIGVVMLLTGNTQQSTPGVATINKNSKCNWDPKTACVGGSASAPTCATSMYNQLMTNNTFKEVLGGDPCASSHLGAIALAVAQTNYADVPNPDLFHALSTLYFALNGPTWRFNTNWLQGPSPCADLWYGVKCFDSGEYTINLYGNNVAGSLPTHIGMMSMLRSFSLGNSAVAGSIPTEIGLLSGLQTFSAFDSFLHSEIPSEIGRCQELLELDLGKTLVTGSLPTEIGNLQNLGLISVQDTFLTGSLPSEIGKLSALTNLDLGRLRYITGTIPDARDWGNLTNLVEFHLAGPSLFLSQFPYYILANSTSMQHFILSGCPLVGTIPTSIGNLSQLQTFILEYNALSGSLPTELGLLTEMVLLLTSDQNIVGTLPSELGQLSKMTSMMFSDNRLTGTIPSELGALSLLQGMTMARNDISGTIPTEICVLVRLHRFSYDSCTRSSQPCVEDSCGYRSDWGHY